MLSMLGQGFVVTLQIFFLTLVGSLPLGVVVALARMSRVKPIAWIMKFYISVMRGTPLMLHPVHPARSIRGCRGLGLFAPPDVHENRVAPGH